MARRLQKRCDPPPENFFSNGEWEAIETVYAIALLMDKTPAEILQAAYDGPEEQSVEPYLDN